ncbi:MAG: nicotinate-nucleotide adenylyltransferase [Pyrinomonadaceae bacterium]
MKPNNAASNFRIAFYGGSFDPPHDGHLTIARRLIEIFALDEFVFIPAFHAPHKKDKKPTSAFHRYAMLCLATASESKTKVSTVELDAPEKPFTYETQTKLKNEFANAEIFFVLGADSWAEIDTWREWEKVLTLTNIIVVTRPDYEIGFAHITEEIENKIVDLRDSQPSAVSRQPQKNGERLTANGEQKIYITDAVNMDVSATEIRRKIRACENDWRKLVLPEVANYIEKYELYI